MKFDVKDHVTDSDGNERIVCDKYSRRQLYLVKFSVHDIREVSEDRLLLGWDCFRHSKIIKIIK